MALATPISAAPVDPGEHYDLLFRQGTLDSVDPGAELHYTRAVTNTLAPHAATSRASPTDSVT